MKQPWPSANRSVPYLWSSLPNSLNKLRICKTYTVGPKDQEPFNLLLADLAVPPSTLARARRKRIDHKPDGAQPVGQSVPQSPSEGNRPIKLYFSLKGVDTKALRQSEQHHFCVGCYSKKIYSGTLARELASCGSFGTRLINSKWSHISSFPRAWSAHKPGEGAKVGKKTVLTFSGDITQEFLSRGRKAAGIEKSKLGAQVLKTQRAEPTRAGPKDEGCLGYLASLIQ